MKPQTNRKIEIKRAKYKYHWYKSMITMLRNKKLKDYKSDKTIGLT